MKLTATQAQNIALKLSDVDDALNRTVEYMSNELTKMSSVQAFHYTLALRECCNKWLVEYHLTMGLLERIKR